MARQMLAFPSKNVVVLGESRPAERCARRGGGDASNFARRIGDGERPH
jgi:hypothetical protein